MAPGGGDRLFLDANVLFSSAYLPVSEFLRLWQLPNTKLITSDYAAEEARKNLKEQKQRERLRVLLREVEIVSAGPPNLVPPGIDLPVKDQPILLAAIAARATHLITGDKKHFGRYFGRAVEGVMILPLSEYLAWRL